MKKEIEKKLARALGAEDTALLPYLPYLLQDLYNLGTPVKPILELISENIPAISRYKLLDLGCGKGYVGLPIAKETGAHVVFVDIFEEFIAAAKQKAFEMGVTHCSFLTEDITETVKAAKDFDMVLFCGVGDVFGDAAATVKTLKQTVKQGGFLLIEESYTLDKQVALKCACHTETLEDWLIAFERAGVRLVAQYNEPSEHGGADEIDFDFDNRHIAQRAAELREKYPHEKALFDAYIQSQLKECDDLQNRLKTCIWLLQAL